jgi:hypothetical protein
MSRIDNILKLIGIATVVIVCVAIMLSIFLFIYGALGGNTGGTQSGAQDQTKLYNSLNDYNYRLDLVKEQTQRLDMYYAAKAATSMSQAEYASWLGQIGALTRELINRENNASTYGQLYLKYLNPGSEEYDRVIQNAAVSEDDVQMAKATYNGNVEIYNKQYGATYGDIPFIQ